MASYLELKIGPKTATQNASDARAANVSGDIIALFNFDPDETLTDQQKVQAVLDWLVSTAEHASAQHRRPLAEQSARDDVEADTDYKFTDV